MRGAHPVAGVIAALVVPAAAPAKVLHFKGKATGEAAAPHMTITFDVTSSKGRATRIANVYVTNAEYGCQMGGRLERNVRFFDAGAVSRSGKLRPPRDPAAAGLRQPAQRHRDPAQDEERQAEPPSGSRASCPLKRGDYNCLAADYFTASRIGG
jgi:hypothetical protein